jgi:hypothetical protein
MQKRINHSPDKFGVIDYDLQKLSYKLLKCHSQGLLRIKNALLPNLQVPDDAWQNYMLHFDNGEGCGFQVETLNLI